MFMMMARVASLRSTCYRLNVGAVLVQGGTVMGIGYNGAPAAAPHCTGNGCVYFNPQAGCGVVHAEENALNRSAAEVVTESDPLDIYVTHSPCGRCAARIVQAKVRTVYYEVEYRDRTPLDFLIERGVKVYRLLPSGFMVDYETGALVQ